MEGIQQIQNMFKESNKESESAISSFSNQEKPYNDSPIQYDDDSPKEEDNKENLKNVIQL